MTARPESSSAPGEPVARLAPGTRVGAVVSDYHADVTGPMTESARRELVAAGLAESDFVVVRAPGAFELPFLARELARRADIDAVLCFALVLKGETEHDRYIADAAAHGLVRASLETATPVHFGVLTCATLEQAIARARPAADGGELDKGREVARAAIGTLQALHGIRES
jgi:6,7-dimethyl-8-ribityllumazine synthase